MVDANATHMYAVVALNPLLNFRGATYTPNVSI